MLTTPAILGMCTGPIALYSGTPAASADADVPVGCVKLAEATPGNANWSAPASGATQLSNYTWAGGSALANGTPTWGRWRLGTNVLDFSVGTSNSDMILNSATITAGVAFTVLGFTLYF